MHLFHDILCSVLSNATTQHLHLGCNARTGFLWIHGRGTVSHPDQHSPDMFHLSLFHQPCSASSTETHHSNRSPPEANDINNLAFWDIMPYMLLESYYIFFEGEGGKLLPYSGCSSAMKIEATGSSKMLVTIY